MDECLEESVYESGDGLYESEWNFERVQTFKHNKIKGGTEDQKADIDDFI